MLTGSISRRAGGLFNSVRMLSQSLIDLGEDVRVIGLKDPDTKKDYNAWHPIQPLVQPNNPLLYPFLNWKTSRAIFQFNPDIVHLHGIWSANSLTAFNLNRHYPLVISPRGMLDPWALEQSKAKKSLFWHILEKHNFQNCSIIHALCSSEKTSIDKIISKQNKTMIVPNGINLPKNIDNIQLLKTHPDYNSEKYILSISRLHPKKGLSELIDAYAKLPKAKKIEFKLKIAGPNEGNYSELLRDKIAGLGLNSYVELIGPAFGALKEELLTNASAFILPSKSEGLPMSILEAWSYGLPVIMTKECNLEESFSLGAAFEISSSFDDTSLGDSLEWIKNKYWNAAGIELVKTKYLWQKVAQQQLATYKQAMSNHHA